MLYIVCSFLLIFISYVVYRSYETGWLRVIFREYIEKKEKKKLFMEMEELNEVSVDPEYFEENEENNYEST